MVRKKDKILLVPVKPVRQENGYECGLASVMTILRTLGCKSRKDTVKRRLGTTSRRGTHPERIKGLFREMDLNFREKHGASLHDLENRVKKQKLCLVVYQAWGSQKYYDRMESGHYSVVFGVEKDYLWLADPYVRQQKSKYGKGIRKIRKETFDGRWKDVDHKGVLYDHWMLAV
ncbi:MAG: hypothetical protein ACD_61C00151G0004 [uncultured bacterium]|nr:MAG: hypothetical protein ACD_61C00151G0004 [uncultured bacterium]